MAKKSVVIEEIRSFLRNYDMFDTSDKPARELLDLLLDSGLLMPVPHTVEVEDSFGHTKEQIKMGFEDED